MEVKIVEETCCTCGILFWIGADFHKRLVSDKKLFYCPSGHSQSYTGMSDHAKWQQALIERDEIKRKKDLEIAELRKELTQKCRRKRVIKKK